MGKKYFADIVINKEESDSGKEVFVVKCTNLGIASQGDTTEHAIEMIKEAVKLYLECEPEAYEELRETAQTPPMFSFVEIKKPIKNA